MNKIIGVVIWCTLLLTCCSKTIYEDVLINYNGSIEEGEYWWTFFAPDTGSHITINFEVLSGSPVDLLLMDAQDFDAFKEIGTDSVGYEIWSLQPEEYGVYSFYADSGQQLRFSMVFAYDTTHLPVDVFLMDSVSFFQYSQGGALNFYEAYLATLGEGFDFDVEVSESLYFVLDNTSDYGYPPVGFVVYGIMIDKYTVRSFTYFEEYSVLAVDSASLTFQDVPSDTVYLVINNAGFVSGGAIPGGQVDFHVSVAEQ